MILALGWIALGFSVLDLISAVVTAVVDPNRSSVSETRCAIWFIAASICFK